MCDIYCENEKEYNYLKSIEIEFMDDKFIEISNNELYFKNYDNILQTDYRINNPITVNDIILLKNKNPLAKLVGSYL